MFKTLEVDRRLNIGIEKNLNDFKFDLESV